MKILFASDIHGSGKYCRELLDAFSREQAEKLVLLGDILYHGPRNPLPEEYDPQGVVTMLNEVKDKILCVRGNCDAEIDCMLLPFPLAENGVVSVDGLNIYLAHGHKEELPLLSGDVYVTGHTHVPLNTYEGEYLHLNPGSVSLPKEDSPRGYIVYENRKFTFKTLDGEQYEERDLSENSVDETPSDGENSGEAENTDEVEKNEYIQPAPRRMPTIRRKVIKRRRII